MENISNKPPHKYSGLFKILDRREDNYSNKIITYEEMGEHTLTRLAAKSKAKIMKIKKYLHERAVR